MRYLILAASLMTAAPAFSADPKPQTTDEKLDAVLGLLQAQGGRFASIEARLDALEGKKAAPVAAAVPLLPAPKPAYVAGSGPLWTYSGSDLARHLVAEHGLSAAALAGLPYGELVRLHSSAHNGTLRTATVAADPCPNGVCPTGNCPTAAVSPPLYAAAPCPTGGCPNAVGFAPVYGSGSFSYSANYRETSGFSTGPGPIRRVAGFVFAPVRRLFGGGLFGGCP